MLSAPDVFVLGLRSLSFVAAFQAAGIAFFLSLFGGQLTAAASAIRRLALTATLAGIFLTLANHLLGPARMTGAFSGALDPSLQMLLLESDAGTAHGIRLLGLVMLAVGFSRSRRQRPAFALIGALITVASFAFMGHTAIHEQRGWLAITLMTHLLIVAFWFGSLLPLHILARRESMAVSGLIIHRFSALATWLVPIIFIAGVFMAAVLLSAWENLLTPYGRLILAKTTAFAILMGLAALNKWRFGPGIMARDTGSLVSFQRSVALEWGVVVVVLTLTAVMTGLFSPTH